jgi:hypothetical protein
MSVGKQIAFNSFANSTAFANKMLIGFFLLKKNLKKKTHFFMNKNPN